MSLSALINWMRGPLTGRIEGAFLRITRIKSLAESFKVPVLEAYAQDSRFCEMYRQAIVRPCAFNNITSNLDRHSYESIGQISYHFLLIVYNSTRFNIKPEHTLDTACKSSDCTRIIKLTVILFLEILKVFKGNVPEDSIARASTKDFERIFKEVKHVFECPVDMKRPRPRSVSSGSTPRQDPDAFALFFGSNSGKHDTSSSLASSRDSLGNTRTDSGVMAGNGSSSGRDEALDCRSSSGQRPASSGPDNAGIGSKRSSSKKVSFDFPNAGDSCRTDMGSSLALTPMNSSMAPMGSTGNTLTAKDLSSSRRLKSTASQQKVSTSVSQMAVSQSQAFGSTAGSSSSVQPGAPDANKDPVRLRNMRLFDCANCLMNYSNERRAQVFARIRAYLGIDDSVRDIDLNVLCKSAAQLQEVLSIIMRG